MAGFDTGANALLGMGQGTVRPNDPSEQIGRFAEIRNALTGYKAERAQSRALAAATDPNGQTDYAKARAAMAADPDAQFNLAQGFSAQNRSRGEDLQNQDAQLAYQEHTRDAAAGAFIRLASNPTDANIKGTASFMAALTPNAAKQIHWTANNIMALPSAQQRAEAIKQLATTSLPGHERVAQAFGTPTSVDDGQTIQTGTQAAGMDGGGFNPAAGIQRQISPETNSSPMDVVNPDGSHSYVRRDQVVGGGKPTVPPEAMGSGRYPGYQAAPAAGQTEAIATTAQAGAQGANSLMQGASGTQDRLGILGNMLGDLTKFQSGPGYERLRHFASIVDNWTGADWKSNDIEGAQSFNKFANQIAQAQAQTLGVGSDAKLASAMHANPNSSLQTNTNRQMLHVLQGNEDAIKAKAAAWQASGMQPSQYQQWNLNFNQSFDPRAYQLRRMSPEEQHSVISSMKKSGELNAFKKAYNAMAAQGLLNNGD